jgi:septal ring factor EnvC (AmiA/AmiB activator)
MLKNDISTFAEPNLFKNNLTNISSSFPSILEDFLKSYKFIHSVPDNTEYQHIFENNKVHLHEYQQNLAKLKKTLNQSTREINDFLSNINEKIQKEKQLNKKYKKELNILQNKENATNELIGDYINIYHMNYLNNWALFLSIFAAGVMNYSLYKAKK